MGGLLLAAFSAVSRAIRLTMKLSVAVLITAILDLFVACILPQLSVYALLCWLSRGFSLDLVGPRLSPDLCVSFHSLDFDSAAITARCTRRLPLWVLQPLITVTGSPHTLAAVVSDQRRLSFRRFGFVGLPGDISLSVRLLLPSVRVVL